MYCGSATAVKVNEPCDVGIWFLWHLLLFIRLYYDKTERGSPRYTLKMSLVYVPKLSSQLADCADILFGIGRGDTA